MSIARQDAWNQDEDLLLAEVVLRHIREGSTQLRAFEEVGRQLSRTSAACGFRWNSFVRKQYKSGIELAKKQRKDVKRNQSPKNENIKEIEDREISIEAPSQDEILSKSSITLEDVLSFIKEKTEVSQVFQKEKQQGSLKLEQLQQENNQLRQEIKLLQQQLHAVEEDYRALLQIMERARKLIVHEEDKVNSKVKFQMDKNGNLERVNK